MTAAQHVEILNLFFPWILLHSPKCHSKFPYPGSHSWLEPKHHLHPSTSVVFDYVPWSAAKLSLLLTMKTLTFNWIYFLSHLEYSLLVLPPRPCSAPSQTPFTSKLLLLAPAWYSSLSKASSCSHFVAQVWEEVPGEQELIFWSY